MQGHQHLFLGTAAGLTGSLSFVEPAAGIAFCASCMIGSLYPDIDMGTSKIGRRAKPAAFILNGLFGHRGFIHTPINGILMTLVIYLISMAAFPPYAYEIASGFAVGFFLHLLQDTMTQGGIMWLWPVKLKIHFTNFKSSSPVHYLITLGMAAVTVIAFILIALSNRPELAQQLHI